MYQASKSDIRILINTIDGVTTAISNSKARSGFIYSIKSF
ncbi:hypothetical protein HMPREF0519_2759 [Lentilactobacillus hilgardii DSM 20176 = ATCC 8290]|uniref:Uncharacterized protein n=1 Tax=Lentilactobacillus hilgardii (strain ATCC 8290 / DSM 20176 / CCUG 30140 / JCM 1155 / KCTC 3500 / NBRC 15886 / NCIMB 8040 / NRRL B-1843 / 9) TaxID=1423757 RepID=C0XNE8_LENH9|nr:hypothetical protein HMPREF0519_2759 [Lentilactobacillus hilgardii DSM 20176 = ATCC 8290]